MRRGFYRNARKRFFRNRQTLWVQKDEHGRQVCRRLSLFDGSSIPLDMRESVENIIRLEDVSYSYYDKIPALSEVSLEVHGGDNVAIIGANGTGKSTLQIGRASCRERGKISG